MIIFNYHSTGQKSISISFLLQRSKKIAKKHKTNNITNIKHNIRKLNDENDAKIDALLKNDIRVLGNEVHKTLNKIKKSNNEIEIFNNGVKALSDDEIMKLKNEIDILFFNTPKELNNLIEGVRIKIKVLNDHMTKTNVLGAKIEDGELINEIYKFNNDKKTINNIKKTHNKINALNNMIEEVKNSIQEFKNELQILKNKIDIRNVIAIKLK